MPITTIGIGAAVAPTVIKTYVSHYTNRKPRRQKPTAHISYDEGLNLVRSFLDYASHHTVEDIQSFTGQWVPSPSWIRTENVPIPADHITKAAEAIIAQLGEGGVQEVGGRQWWQWRRKAAELKGEWIEMRADYNARKQLGQKSSRIMLYVHGGAYFFGSVDEHRYQMQRHARKLKARVFAPRYRLSPQFPFPCGLLDCLAAYLYLLSLHDPTEIVLAGDSAGGGMVVSILCILRNQGLPLPAGAILISPWVDLTHSFPSVAGDNEFDYIPAHGFMQKPSASWPPPNDDDMETIRKGAGKGLVRHKLEKPEVQKMRAQGFTEHEMVQDSSATESTVPGAVTEVRTLSKHTENSTPGPSKHLSINVDGMMVELRDQIQMYATNQLISHPLVSPVLQPSLGGLCPLLILTGGGEVLRDEQIYLAHKAANPARYPLGAEYRRRYDPDDRLLNKYKPTPVQLQVWEDLCHVAPTLSFTRPAKFMYRSIAQFGAWALARAQNVVIDVEDEDVSVISTTDSDTEGARNDIDPKKAASERGDELAGVVGAAGDALPPFKNHMIRQRVDRHGRIYPLASASSLPALQLAPSEVGVIKVGPVKKWMDAKSFWDNKYAKNKRRIQQKRIRYLAKNGPTTFGDGETPPPSALAGRQHEEGAMISSKLKKSFGLAMWSGWGSKHDEETIKKESLEAEYAVVDGGSNTSATVSDMQKPRNISRSRAASGSKKPGTESRSRSARRTTLVRDKGQVEDAPAAVQPTPEAVYMTPVVGPSQGLSAVDGTVPTSLKTNYLTPVFLPRTRTNSYLKDRSSEMLNSENLAPAMGVPDDNTDDNASAVAVFAASGISKDRSGQPASVVVTDGIPRTDPLASTREDNLNLLDGASTSHLHSRSRSALGGYDTPGSSRSIERLISHQVDVNGTGQEGELHSLMSTTERAEASKLTTHDMNMNGLRSPSSTAIVQAEGVVGTFTSEDKIVKDLGTTDSGLISDATKIGTATGVPRLSDTAERPGVYERFGTVHKTAFELL